MEVLTEIKLEEIGIDKDDLKLILASAGAFYSTRNIVQKFEENYGNNYEDNEFTNELFTALDKVCSALGYSVYSFIE